MAEKIIKWYKMGLWTKDMVLSAIAKGIITENKVLEIIKEA